jgi:hypothetical protein
MQGIVILQDFMPPVLSMDILPGTQPTQYYFSTVEGFMKNNFKQKLTSEYPYVETILGPTSELKQVEP